MEGKGSGDGGTDKGQGWRERPPCRWRKEGWGSRDGGIKGPRSGDGRREGMGLKRWTDRGTKLLMDRQMDVAFPKGSFPLRCPNIQPPASLMDVPKSMWLTLLLGVYRLQDPRLTCPGAPNPPRPSGPGTPPCSSLPRGQSPTCRCRRGRSHSPPSSLEQGEQ